MANLNVINPKDNYAACRALSKEVPGLQWLNLSRKSNNAPEQLYEVFTFVKYFGRKPEEDTAQVAEKGIVAERGDKEIWLVCHFCRRFRGSSIVTFVPN